jgi:hypothetical protein
MGKTFTVVIKEDTRTVLEDVKAQYTRAMKKKKPATWDDFLFTLVTFFKQSPMLKKLKEAPVDE